MTFTIDHLSDSELEQLLTSAELATSGPWHSSGGKANARVQARVRLADGGWTSYILCAMTRTGWRGGSQVANDAYYISLLSPERVKALVEEVISYRKTGLNTQAAPEPAISEAWIERYCELMNRDPDGEMTTHISDAVVTSTFRDVSRRELELMLASAPQQFLPVAEYIGGVGVVFERLDKRLKKGDKLFALLPAECDAVSTPEVTK